MVSPALQAYVARMKGQRYDPSKLGITPKPPTRIVVLLSSFIGSFVGIAMVSALTYNAQWFVERNTPVIAGSFGASAVLIYGAIEAPLSQPRNVIGGHIMSSLIGVSLYKLFNLLSAETFARLHWLLCSLAVSISLFCMQLTHTVHPPASATALIAVSGGATIYDLGYWYVLCPIALGVALMMVVAMVVNNVARKYPTHWWNPKQRMVTVVDQDMSTTIADFVRPREDQHQGERKDRAHEDAHKHQAVASSSSSTHSPSTVNDMAETSPAVPHKQSHFLHHHHYHSQAQPEPQAQYAVYYGGGRKEELKDGERMMQDESSEHSLHDVEHGQSNPRSCITIEMRGSPHPSHPSMSEEEYRLTIERLQQRVHELELQLASPK